MSILKPLVETVVGLGAAYSAIKIDREIAPELGHNQPILDLVARCCVSVSVMYLFPITGPIGIVCAARDAYVWYKARKPTATLHVIHGGKPSCS